MFFVFFCHTLTELASAERSGSSTPTSQISFAAHRRRQKCFLEPDWWGEALSLCMCPPSNPFRKNRDFSVDQILSQRFTICSNCVQLSESGQWNLNRSIHNKISNTTLCFFVLSSRCCHEHHFVFAYDMTYKKGSTCWWWLCILSGSVWDTTDNTKIYHIIITCYV